MKTDAALEARVHLAAANADLLAVVVAKAADRGVGRDTLCLLVLDTRDPVAHELTEALLERSESFDLQAVETHIEARKMIPTAIAALGDLKLARALLDASHPLVAASLDRAPRPGTVRVVAIGDGGASLLHLPIKPTKPVSSA